jgi:hypothetical protein
VTGVNGVGVKLGTFTVASDFTLEANVGATVEVAARPHPAKKTSITNRGMNIFFTTCSLMIRMISLKTFNSKKSSKEMTFFARNFASFESRAAALQSQSGIKKFWGSPSLESFSENHIMKLL